MARLIPAIAASLLLVLSSPFIGEFRDFLKATFPATWIRLVAGSAALVMAAALAIGVARIRSHRAARYGALALAALLLVLYVARFRTGNDEVDAVQLFHFIEYGLITVLFYRAFATTTDASPFVFPLLCGLLVGTLEEWLQWFVPSRTGDLGDVALNLWAVVCGLVFSAGLWPPPRLTWRLTPGARRRAARLAAIVVLALAGFFQSAHVGHEIADPEIGRFRSYYTADGLARLDAARAPVWRAAPPSRMPVLGKQDYFLTEGGWHAQARNEGYAARDFRTAWFENRILEKYYDAFLDLRSFSSHEIHRWAPAQRAEVEAGLPDTSSGGYTSRAGEARVYLRPTATELWLAAIAAAAALVWAGGVRRLDLRRETGPD